MRTILIILLMITSFMTFVVIGASSHGNITMENSEIANSVYSGIIFLLTAIFNGISLRAKFSKIITILTLILNLVCVLILIIFFFGMFNPSLKNDLELIVITFIVGIEIFLILKLIIIDFIKLIKKLKQTTYN